MLGQSPIRHGSGADCAIAYVCTCTYGFAALQLRQARPSRSRYLRLLFLPYAAARRINQLNSAQSRQEIRHRNVRTSSWFYKQVHPSSRSSVGNTYLLSVCRCVYKTYMYNCDGARFCNYLGNTSILPLQLSGSATPCCTQKAAGRCWWTRKHRAKPLICNAHATSGILEEEAGVFTEDL